MNITNPINTAKQNTSLLSSADTANSAAPTNNQSLASQSSASQNSANLSTAVSISGQSLMLSRLFGSAEPEITSGSNGVSLDNIGVSPAHSLTQQDRDLLAKMYEFAQQQGADLQHVDQIAISLGNYRKADNGNTISSFNNGTNFDLEGHQMTVSFSEQDAKTAQNILNSSSIKSTQLDQGFLQYTLDAGRGALSTAANLQFLEQMVTKFSNEGANTSLSPSFASFSSSDATVNHAVFTQSEDIVNTSPAATFVADYTSVNGVGHWRTPELAAANKAGSALSATILSQLKQYTENQSDSHQSLIDALLKRHT